MEVTEVYLTQRPGADNSPSNGNFGVRRTQLQAPSTMASTATSTNNYVIVKSLYLSVDPALRQTLNSYHILHSRLNFAKRCNLRGGFFEETRLRGNRATIHTWQNCNCNIIPFFANCAHSSMYVLRIVESVSKNNREPLKIEGSERN